ncbi:MAG: polysaccharide biosynthesis/export family protein [Chitinophagaceae bacterium]
MLKKLFKNSWVFLLIVVAIGCQPSKKLSVDYLYFQKGLDSLSRMEVKEPVIKVNDVISVLVTTKSLNQEQVIPFNMPPTVGAPGYLVNSSGNIEMPVIGAVKVAGLTKPQLQNFLQPRLATYIKDPTITVKYAQFNVNVLGEVGAPGTKTFTSEYVTLLDAIGASGDLRETGKRQGIMVIREENSRKKYHYVDLRDASFFQSPAYQLQPNDIIYVGATEKRLRALDVDPEKGKTLNVVTTVFGIASGLFALIYTITR